MSVKILSSILSEENVGTAEKLVAVFLASSAGGDGICSIHSLSILRRKCSIVSNEAVSNILKTLEHKEYLKRVIHPILSEDVYKINDQELWDF